MSGSWQTLLKEELATEMLQWDDQALSEYSRDYHTFSPILTRELADRTAQCIVSPCTEEELDSVLSFVAKAGVPITVRGGGTGNYGQCVPLTGGIVLNLAKYNRIQEVGDGYMRAQAGARLGRMESVARKAGMELRTMPSTFQSATIGGFLCGGFGGIGSITWGTIWDGLVRSLAIKTVESPPRTILVEGEDTRPYLHTYGTIGILSEVEIVLAPRREWEQWAVTFDTFERAFVFGRSVAEDPVLHKRLVSVNEWPISRYFLPFDFPEGRASVLLEVDAICGEALARKVEAAGGDVHRKIEANQYHLGVGVSDFSWNHTTLWARKSDSRLTYLQVGFDNDRVHDQFEHIRSHYPEVTNHIEFVRQGGQLFISGLPLLPFTSDKRLNALIAEYERIGVRVSNPHTWDLEGGGRSFARDKLWHIKWSNDPFELLNQEKLKPPFERTDGSSPRRESLKTAPDLINGKLTLQVSRITAEAKGVLSLELRDPDGTDLPPFTAGAHLSIYLSNGTNRQYSLLNDPRERHRYVVAVALSPTSRGGSRYAHRFLRQGDRFLALPPRNNFALDERAGGYCFVAGGIGITPILSMVRWCTATGKEWRLFYTAHSRLRAAFYEELQVIGEEQVCFHFTEEHSGQRIPIQGVVSSLGEAEHLYCCGPASLMREVREAVTGHAESRTHFEWFSAPELTAAQINETKGFEVILRKSAQKLWVAPSQSILEVLEENGFEPPFFCRSGICRTCEVGVCTGRPDHRDFVLSEEERAEGKRMMICVSRAVTPQLEIDL